MKTEPLTPAALWLRKARSRLGLSRHALALAADHPQAALATLGDEVDVGFDDPDQHQGDEAARQDVVADPHPALPVDEAQLTARGGTIRVAAVEHALRLHPAARRGGGIRWERSGFCCILAVVRCSSTTCCDQF